MACQLNGSKNTPHYVTPLVLGPLFIEAHRIDLGTLSCRKRVPKQGLFSKMNRISAHGSHQPGQTKSTVPIQVGEKDWGLLLNLSHFNYISCTWMHDSKMSEKVGFLSPLFSFLEIRSSIFECSYSISKDYLFSAHFASHIKFRVVDLVRQVISA